MIKLRRFYSPSVTTALYETTYDSTRWPEHVERIGRTASIAQSLIGQHDLRSVADLSCGDGTLVKQLFDVPVTYLRDGNILDDLGLIESVDLFVCTETIEHLEAPWTVLERIAEKTRWLVLSTPLNEDPAIGNYEHYWSFTADDVASLLHQSNFHNTALFILEDPLWTYTYQVWTAEVNDA